MKGQLGRLATAMNGVDDPYAVQAFEVLKSILIDQAAAIRELKADATARESLLVQHELDSIRGQRRCPGCRSMVPAGHIEHLGQCTGCADAEERLEARV